MPNSISFLAAMQKRKVLRVRLKRSRIHKYFYAMLLLFYTSPFAKFQQNNLDSLLIEPLHSFACLLTNHFLHDNGLQHHTYTTCNRGSKTLSRIRAIAKTSTARNAPRFRHHDSLRAIGRFGFYGGVLSHYLMAELYQ